MGKEGKPQRSRKNKKLKTTIVDYSSHKRRKNKGDSNRIQKVEDDVQPKNDQEDVPRKLKDILDWQEKMKNSKGKEKQNKKAISFQMERGMSRPLEPAPVFKRGKKESNKAFFRRVDDETNQVLQTSQFEDKYKVKVIENKDGETVIEKKERSKRKKEKDKERKKNKKLKEQEKKFDKKPDFHYLKDKVHFGEVVMQPPTLTAKPRISKTEPGSKQSWTKSLLLNSLFTDKGDNTEKVLTHKPKSLATRKTGKTVKRKHLSMAQQRITDQQRQLAIDQYREMRDNKIKAAKT